MGAVCKTVSGGTAWSAVSASVYDLVYNNDGILVNQSTGKSGTGAAPTGMAPSHLQTSPVSVIGQA